MAGGLLLGQAIDGFGDGGDGGDDGGFGAFLYFLIVLYSCTAYRWRR